MIKDREGVPIRTLDEWQQTFAPGNKALHWKEGRSAHALAEFILHRDGINQIKARLQEVLRYDIYFEKAVPEYEVRFDRYGQGRVHDLAIFGQTQQNERLFIGVEAKVDETFNQSVQDIYLNAKLRQLSGESTNAPERVEELIQLHFDQPDRRVFDLKYQLLYTTAGTLAVGAELAVMYVLVFKTDLYDRLKGVQNLHDYLSFLELLGAEELPASRTGSLAHKSIIDEEELITIYEEIDF
jgi:hypothetical protein